VAQDVIRALCETVLTSLEPESACFHRASQGAESAARFVADTIASAPCHLRLGIAVLAATFDLSAVVFAGRRFRNAGPLARRGHLERWRQSSLRPKRDFVRYVESLAVFHVASAWHANHPMKSEEMTCSRLT